MLWRSTRIDPLDASIFHLSLPAKDLAATSRFYCDVLGAVRGRATCQWIDLIVFGHQVTFHERPDEVRTEADQGVQHFGAVLEQTAWRALRDRIVAVGWPCVMPPTVFSEGTSDEHAKVMLRDPNGHLIEIKASRDITTVIPPSRMVDARP